MLDNMRRYVAAVAAVVRKDLLTEWRNREVISAMLVFSILVVLIFSFALDLDRNMRENVASGVLWVTFTFAATLGLNRSFAPELDKGSLEGLLLSPIDRGVVYFGKLISTLLYIIIVEAIVIPIFTFLFDINLFQPMFLLVVALGTLGYTVVGTLLSAVAMRTRAREVMLPILLFPVTLPVILAAVIASNNILIGEAWSMYSNAFNLVLVYDVIFLAVAFMLFDYLVDE